MQPGRKSSAANVVALTSTSSRLVLSPVGLPLTKDELAYFNFIVRNNTHLKPIDVPNVMLYACAIVRALKLRNKADAGFEKEARTALALARSLRLTPQSTMQGVTAARRRAEAAPVSYYEVMRAERQAQDEEDGDEAH
jgi:hypothetical protein